MCPTNLLSSQHAMRVSMEQPFSNQRAETIQQAAAAAQARATHLKSEADSATKESTIWQNLLSYQQKSWWFHIRNLFEREADFFRLIRGSQAPVISQLETLYREAKAHTEDLILQFPKDIERMAQTHKLPLDHAQSRHPKYLFREGFLTLELDDSKRLAHLRDYEEKLAEMPPDIEAIAQALKLHDQRLFGRPFDGRKFLDKIRRNYLSILKKSKKPDGDPVPLRQIARRLADNERTFRRDEFLIDLSRLAVDGPPDIDGYRFEFQQTKDTEQGFLLVGRAGRGMVNLLIFKKGTL